jgi:hypothetical protein
MDVNALQRSPSDILSPSYLDAFTGKPTPVVRLRPDGSALTLDEQCAQIMLPLKFIEVAAFRIAELQQQRHERSSPLKTMRISLPSLVPLRVMSGCLRYTSRKLAGGRRARVGKTTRLLEDCIIDRVMRGHCKKFQVRLRVRSVARVSLRCVAVPAYGCCSSRRRDCLLTSAQQTLVEFRVRCSPNQQYYPAYHHFMLMIPYRLLPPPALPAYFPLLRTATSRSFKIILLPANVHASTTETKSEPSLPPRTKRAFFVRSFSFRFPNVLTSSGEGRPLCGRLGMGTPTFVACCSSLKLIRTR